MGLSVHRRARKVFSAVSEETVLGARNKGGSTLTMLRQQNGALGVCALGWRLEKVMNTRYKCPHSEKQKTKKWKQQQQQ